MKLTWRWFGPGDPIPLAHIRHAGAEGVVTALHEIPTGEVWSSEAIESRKREIERAGLEWAVVESVPVHADVKSRTGGFRRRIENFAATIRNLGRAGIRTVCYNFMPVLDWTRTDLRYPVPGGGEGLRFDATALAAFDLHVLRRPNAAADYDDSVLEAASDRAANWTEHDRKRLEHVILSGLPGGEGAYDPHAFTAALEPFSGMTPDDLREHLYLFLGEIMPVAEESGVLLAIHPDDPPAPLFGIPRVVSTETDIELLLGVRVSHSNGLTFCSGSLGARTDNDLAAIAGRFADRIHFVHLRNVHRDHDGSFTEVFHLSGDLDLLSLIRILSNGTAGSTLPIRPDHGVLIGPELAVGEVRPGYSWAGRLRGLAELRGAIKMWEHVRI